LIEVKNIHKKFGDNLVLNDVSFNFQRGKTNLIIGESGSGKTTLLKILIGLYSFDKGSISYDGRIFNEMKLKEKRLVRQEIGMLFQGGALFDYMTVEENILLPSWSIKSLDSNNRLTLVYQIMPELKEMSERKALLLSGGQQKMAALGRALVSGTQLLLLDEPFEGVAPALSQRLSEVIKGLKKQNMSIILSQSEQNHTEDIFDKKFLIERGENVN